MACVPSGDCISVKGYLEKIPFLLDTVTVCMLSLIHELKSGDPSLQKKFLKAKEGLLRETKNYLLDTPYEVASYNAWLLMEESVWLCRDLCCGNGRTSCREESTDNGGVCTCGRRMFIGKVQDN